MLALRPLDDHDVPLVETWLNQDHVKKWYEIPDRGITIDDWMFEINERTRKFGWLTYLIVSWRDCPIGLCQYYKCVDSDEDFGTLPVTGAYGIDYLIGEAAYLARGLGKGMIQLLVAKIFSLPDAQRVTADIDENNVASEKSLLSCGFTRVDAERSRYVLERQAWEERCQ